jgi:polyribonucleotide nucleotidyltransferase
MGAVLSADRENDPDALAMLGASAALSLSEIPWAGPTGSVRVGRVDGELIANPTHAQMEESDLDMVVAGSKDAILMVEAGAKEIPEDAMLKALSFAHDVIRDMVKIQEDLIAKCGKEKLQHEPEGMDDLLGRMKDRFQDKVTQALCQNDKKARHDAVAAVGEEVAAALTEISEEAATKKRAVMEVLEKNGVRSAVKSGKRVDGRALDEVRQITCEVGVLPRTHGSAIFTRGETQALVVTTLGTSEDEQKIDGLREEYWKKFMLHYNFPPFCVGECRPIRGPGRREIGHGNLAERSLIPVQPTAEKFPYTVRVVSDVLESNGSSSMASVCGGTLSLMDAGVPICNPVAGIAMGLVMEDGQAYVLSDILGDEDHYGDMDFKVAGTQKGVTALQMDIKIGGISEEIMARALEQAREGRIHILREMLSVIKRPRDAISEHAPRLIRITIDPEKIGEVIGPGGKMIRSIQDETGANIEIDDDGTVLISADSTQGAEAAKARVEAITKEIEVGEYFEGKVVSVKDFGAFVQLAPGKDGLVHVSELSDSYVDKVADVVNLGDEMRVKVIGIDNQGRVKLSRKAVILEEKGDAPDGDAQ